MVREKKKKNFRAAPPVILRPGQLPMSPMPRAGPACLRHSFERRNQSTYKILVTDYWSISKQ